MIAWLGLGGALWSTGTSAQSLNLTGQWTASPLREQWSFPRWEQECGPKPAPRGVGGGTASVVEKGGQLTISGAGRVYRTTDCWEQYPGLRRVAHSKGAQSWSNTCRTADSDPRRALVQTSVTATDKAIALRETGKYSFRIKTAACDAQVTRTRTWSRKLVAPDIGETPSSREEAIAAAGAAEPSAAAQSNESPVQAPDTQPETVERSDNCASPGAPHSIELPQLVQWLEPGRTLQLKPQVRDERGCRIRKAKLTYRFEPPADQLQVDERTGMVRVAADAEQGSYSLTIRSGGASRVVEIPVLSKDGMAALLGSPNQVAAPLSSSQARPVGVWGQLGAAAARAEDTATPRKWAFAGLAGLIVLGLAALGFRLLRTGTRPTGLSVAHRPSMGDGAITVRSAVETPAAESPGSRPLASSVRPSPAPPSSPSVQPVSPQPTTPRAIPRRAPSPGPGSAPPPTPSFQPDSLGVGQQTAPAERARVSTPPPKPGSKRPPGAGVCPACGTRYTDGSLFCGMDGVRLRRDPTS